MNSILECQESASATAPQSSTATQSRLSLRKLLLLAVLAVATIVVEGYHYGTDDAAIFVPAIERFAHPSLFPFGEVFFLSHSHNSAFAILAGGLARLLHLSAPWSVFIWFCFATWLLLIAAWQMAACFFAGNGARWTAVATLAAMLPVQVAGTAIPIADAYFTARTLSTPLTLLALAAALRGRWRWAVLWTLLTAAVHPQMALFAAVLVGGLRLAQFVKQEHPQLAYNRALPLLLFVAGPQIVFPSGAATGAYREALYARVQFFAASWTIAQWAGVLLPLAILVWLRRSKLSVVSAQARQLCLVLLTAGSLATVAFLLISSSHRFDSLVRLQPMRIFQLLYIVMFLLLGGLAAEYLIRARAYRAFLLFAALAGGMYALDRVIYPASPHVEFPGIHAANPWLEAFAWIRHNTPENAVFAIDPGYLMLPGEDGHGFRALTERSVLADGYKDSGVAAMFPAVAPEWGREMQAQQGWRSFRLADFQRLASRYPITWVAVDPAQAAGLDCPFQNRALAVCRIPRGTRDSSPGDSGESQPKQLVE